MNKGRESENIEEGSRGRKRGRREMRDEEK